MLGMDKPLTAEAIGHAFGNAGRVLWHNAVALFTPETAHWGSLAEFWQVIYWPYLVGSLAPGVVIVCGALLPDGAAGRAYQNARRKRLQAKLEALRRPACFPERAGLTGNGRIARP